MNIFNQFKKCFIIAEIGVNHNGSMDMACKLIDNAKIAGADAVKFQTYNANLLAAKDTPKVEYQKKGNEEETHYEMLKTLELSKEDHCKLKQYCDRIGIEFLSTPYDLQSASFLAEKIKVKYIKTASADLVDHQLHQYLARQKIPTIVSTGMSTLGEIEDTCNIYFSENNQDIILMHCVSNYPCSNRSLNLKVIETMRQAFNLPVGYSDHSKGCTSAILACALQARVFERHFTLDCNLAGPDHKASSTPSELKNYIQSIREAEIMLGTSVKRVQAEELDMRLISRKSIVLAKDLGKGDLINSSNITLRRPGSGLTGNQLDIVLGKKLRASFKNGHSLKLTDLE